MEMMPKLWLVKSTTDTTRSAIFYIGEPYCGVCKKEVLDGYYMTNWARKNTFSGFICFGCAKLMENFNTHTQEYRKVRVCSERPSGSTPYPMEYHGLQTSDRYTDVFEAADKQEQGVEIIDKTVYSLKAPRKADELEYIGKPDMKLLEEKERVLEPEEAETFLKNLLTTTPTQKNEE